MVEVTNEIPSIIKRWAKAISLQKPRLMSNFYCRNAVLVGTYSEPYEVGINQIYKYFTDFLSAKNMSCRIVEQTCQHIGELKVSSGVYEFTANGEIIKARFTYTIIPRNGEDKILNHHSSVYEG
jgi:hypothetical protein